MNKTVETINNPTHLDFEKDQDSADKWGEQTYDGWFEHHLTDSQRTAIKDFSKIPDYVNGYLKATKGEFITDLNLIPNHENILGNRDPRELINQTKEIDQALQHAALPQSMTVYLRTDETFFGEIEHTLHDILTGELKFPILHNISQNFQNQKVIINQFLVPSLVRTPGGNKKYWNMQFPIVIKIHLPADIHAAYLGKNSHLSKNSEMLIARNYSLKFGYFSVQNTTTKQIVNVDATLSVH